MDTVGLVRLFRKDMADETAPPLWSDEEVYGYADEAQKRFCRKTGGIPDSVTPEVCEVIVAIDATTVDLHPSILKIRGAYRTSDGMPIPIVNHEDMNVQGLRFDGKKGPLSAFVIGMTENVGYFLPIPNVADTLVLIVDRLPLCAIDSAKQPQKLEIGEEHHRNLLLGMKQLAYEKQDAETFDKTKADEFEVKFEEYCFTAKMEKDRKKHKTRVVAYGGIPIDTSSRGRSRDY